MSQQENQITAQGAARLNQKLESLSKELSFIESEIQRVLGRNGCRDDSYQELVYEKRYLKNAILEVRKTLENVTIIDTVSETESVSLGSKVKLVNHKLCYNFQIVSTIEANPLQGRISDQSLIGSTLVGSHKGDVVYIEMPEGKTEFIIKEIK